MRAQSRFTALPASEKGGDGASRVRCSTAQNLLVQRLRSCKTFCRALGLAFHIRAQKIRRVVAKEKRGYANRSRFSCRNNKFLRPLHFLLAAQNLLDERQYLQQFSLFGKQQRKGDIALLPAVSGQAPFFALCIVPFHKCLEHQRSTSQSLRSSTPSTSCAWKNIG